MPPLRISVLKLHAGAQIPRYAHIGPFGDLAADLHAVSGWTVRPGETIAIPTGLALGLPPELGAIIEDRSSLALRGLTTLAGVIDSGYRGEIKVVLTNVSAREQTVFAGDRIAQLRIVQRLQADFVEVDTLEETPRNIKGFGSSGA